MYKDERVNLQIVDDAYDDVISHYIYIIINQPFQKPWHYYHKTFRYDFCSPTQKSSNQNIVDVTIQYSDWLGFFCFFSSTDTKLVLEILTVATPDLSQFYYY